MTSVSIVIPCFNEERTIGKVLEAIHEQTYPKDEMEVVIADGMSTDGTRQVIAAFAGEHPGLHITVVDNPKRHIPAGVNTAIRQARGRIIVRMDAHAWPYPEYVSRCVEDLQAGLGDNVGGVWEIRPGAATWVAGAISTAASHPLGAGDALYRHTHKAGEVDTVPFGAFKRELLALVGFFNESLLTNEDYEFNTRIRERGGKVWLDPAIRSVYYARSTFAALASQYWRYGFWKVRMLRKYPGSLRWRQALPPVFILSLFGLGFLGLIWSGFWWLLLAELFLYAFTLGAAGLVSAVQKKSFTQVIGFPIAILVMHFSWGSGFIWSIIKR